MYVCQTWTCYLNHRYTYISNYISPTVRRFDLKSGSQGLKLKWSQMNFACYRKDDNWSFWCSNQKHSKNEPSNSFQPIINGNKHKFLLYVQLSDTFNIAWLLSLQFMLRPTTFQSCRKYFLIYFATITVLTCSFERILSSVSLAFAKRF